MDKIELLIDKIEEADAVCIGGASGLSSAAGYDFYYKNNDLFKEIFGKFIDKYHIKNAFNGFYYPYKTNEEYWAFLATSMHFILHASAGPVYENLAELVEDKEVFAVTTNQDGLFSRILPDEKIATIQGDDKYLQCGVPCHDELYSSEEIIEKLYNNISDDCKIPTEMIPKCPKCGHSMEPWVRGYHFLEGQKYKEEYSKWLTFLEENMNKNILFLELGVGRMTPMFIQQPFWRFTHEFTNAYYININPKDALMPDALKTKGTLIHEDIAKVFEKAIEIKSK